MNDKFENYFRGKKVLITGHTGFKGSWLTTWLLDLGAQVTGYSKKPPSNPSMFEILELEEKIDHINGDIRDFNHLKNVIETHEPEIVFHMAAQALVRKSYFDPKYTYEVNVMGTVNLLEAIRSTESVKTVINVTSDKCYENKNWVYGYRENDPLGGYDPYSSSKGCSELVTSAYKNSFFNPSLYKESHEVALSSVRAGNVIGGGDWAEDRLVPDCINSLAQNKTILIRSPQSKRPWQHVLDALYGYLTLCCSMIDNGQKFSQEWNFGPEETSVISVEELVKKMISIWGSGDYKLTNLQGLHEASLLKLDISKAQYYLNWNPILSLDEALQNTVSWYKNYYSGENNMYFHTLSQIKEFMKNSK